MTNNFNQETRIHKISTKSLDILAIVLILSGMFIGRGSTNTHAA
jgi:hypothetical protein